MHENISEQRHLKKYFTAGFFIPSKSGSSRRADEVVRLDQQAVPIKRVTNSNWSKLFDRIKMESHFSNTHITSTTCNGNLRVWYLL